MKPMEIINETINEDKNLINLAMLLRNTMLEARLMEGEEQWQKND